ncbi:putative membrane protein (DUF2053) [Plasmodiophora brassicae]|uniref:BOS complex subunit TMEM147 n=2 Tax=Plasmodiophora brassicae TaxID=37360 RepID=A0A3P3YAU4_PLABS|nr:unnamed protein product [Plasmodiophora brassicae]
MTLFHFLNCAALSLGPHAVVYHFQYAASRTTFTALLVYVVLNLVRIIAVVPVVGNSLVVARAFDVAGLWATLTMLSARNATLVAIAWAAIDSVCSNAMLLIDLLRSSEFSWGALESAMLSSPTLLMTIAVVLSMADARRNPKSASAAGAFVANVLAFVVAGPVLLAKVQHHIACAALTAISCGLLAMTAYGSRLSDITLAKKAK